MEAPYGAGDMVRVAPHRRLLAILQGPSDLNTFMSATPPSTPISASSTKDAEWSWRD